MGEREKKATICERHVKITYHAESKAFKQQVEKQTVIA